MKTEVVLKSNSDLEPIKVTPFNENRSCIEIQVLLVGNMEIGLFNENRSCIEIQKRFEEIYMKYRLMKTEVVLKYL